ncbi:MAG TPA: TSUP family transporter [Euzebyales bacterium]|nr:TSUP family transporter [Euzebyales bacterium]
MSLELTPLVVAVIGAAAFLIGLSKGGVGGGIGPLITILVAVIVTPSHAIGVLLPLLMIGDLAAVWVHRADWDRHIVARLLPAATAGVVVASLFLRQTSDRGIEIFLAVLSVAFVSTASQSPSCAAPGCTPARGWPSPPA